MNAIIMPMTPEEMMGEARRRAGTDYPDEEAREPLDRLVAAFNHEGQLHAEGARALQDRLVRILTNRQYMLHDFEAHPEIAQQKIDRPIFICGMARTGSTKTQKLLAASGDFNWLSYWMALNPARTSFSPDDDVLARIEDCETFVQWFDAASPDVKRGHAFATHEPEEESFILEHSLITPVFMGWAPIGSYLEWLGTADMTAQFSMLRDMLKYLQWQQIGRGHAGGEKRWILKSPLYTGLEPLLREAFPDASLLMTHRSPLKTIPSGLKLLEAFHMPFSSAKPEPKAFAAGIAMAANRHMQWRQSQSAVTMLDIDFETLIKNPETAIRIIYQFIGESLSETSLEKMLNWDRTNVQHHHGRHDYSLADYNFDEKQLLDQFADYVEFVSALIPPDGSA
jgi:hypothetical protein